MLGCPGGRFKFLWVAASPLWSALRDLDEAVVVHLTDVTDSSPLLSLETPGQRVTETLYQASTASSWTQANSLNPCVRTGPQWSSVTCSLKTKGCLCWGNIHSPFLHCSFWLIDFISFKSHQTDFVEKMQYNLLLNLYINTKYDWLTGLLRTHSISRAKRPFLSYAVSEQ